MIAQLLLSVKCSRRIGWRASTRLASLFLVVALAFIGLSLRAVELGATKAKASRKPVSESAKATAWQDTSGKRVLCISANRLIVTEPNSLQVLGVERRDAETWAVRRQGLLETWKVSQGGGVLKTEIAGQSQEYRPLASAPSKCELRPFPLGKATKLSPERTHAIEEEIVRRLQVDQVAGRAARAGGPSADPVITENTAYLRGLLREVGWIDTSRFNAVASGNAVILAQHSRDLSLMMAVLPFVEHDFKTSPDGNQVFAVLYDRVQILLGLKQRYGSQLGVDSAGNPMVLPLEDPARVEEFRKSIGLSPLADYFEMAKELYPGKTIRMPRSDE